MQDKANNFQCFFYDIESSSVCVCVYNDFCVDVDFIIVCVTECESELILSCFRFCLSSL